MSVITKLVIAALLIGGIIYGATNGYGVLVYMCVYLAGYAYAKLIDTDK